MRLFSGLIVAGGVDMESRGVWDNPHIMFIKTMRFHCCTADSFSLNAVIILLHQHMF